jgi:hypothetical protein
MILVLVAFLICAIGFLAVAFMEVSDENLRLKIELSEAKRLKSDDPRVKLEELWRKDA